MPSTLTSTGTSAAPARSTPRRRPVAFLLAALAAVALPLLMSARPADAGTPPNLSVTLGHVPGQGYSATVYNIGGSNTGQFRVAILAGAYSRSVYITNLKPGTKHVISLSQTGMCYQPVAVIADLEHKTGDTTFSNNHTAGTSPCPTPIDNGPAFNGVSEG